MRAADARWASWERYNAVPAKGFRQVAPEFVIEVRSESDTLKTLREKMQMWLDNGAELAWLVDPSRKIVEIFRSGQKVEVQEGHSAAYGEGLVSGFVLELGRVWS